ncbi:hypothetical protein BC829DRAFT_362100, partial [Chytridium lagenaria]
GRVVSRRDAGKKLVFLDIERNNTKLQAVLKSSMMGPETFQASPQISIGDVIHVQGFPGKTPSGQLSIFAKSFSMLAPCLHRLPNVLSDSETRSRQRYLDMIVNKHSIDTIKVRSKIISTIREFLNSREFIEVETPILASQAGGANARPFSTVMNANEMKLEMRISPEIYLKKLVIGGLDKVFEIGKQFRNEGLDPFHNPEFTTCEFYQAYATIDDMVAITEDLLRSISLKVLGTTKVKMPGGFSGDGTEIDLDLPFKRIDILPTLEARLELKLPDFTGPEEDIVRRLLEICSERCIPCPGPKTIPRLLDRLISEFIEPDCVSPTFLFGHPSIMSPLAKDGDSPGVSERFELFIGGKEIVNAYSELNNPLLQRSKFQNQVKDRTAGDVEAHPMDESFCTALEYGLPPTAGWGLGVDRLCMFFTGCRRIRDVIPFPILK